MAGKLPAIQFYTGDYTKDPHLSMCAPATRGIWMDLLCAMHENNRSGQITGTPQQMSRLCRCTAVEFADALAELTSTKTANVTERNGIVTVVCRRMQREAKTREDSNLRVKKFRGDGDVTDLKRESSNASSSSSSSSVTNTQKNVRARTEIPAVEIRSDGAVPPNEKIEYQQLIFDGLASRRMDSPFEHPDWVKTIEFGYEKNIPPEKFFGCIDYVKSWAKGRVTPEMVANNFGKFLDTAESSAFVNPNTGKGLK